MLSKNPAELEKTEFMNCRIFIFKIKKHIEKFEYFNILMQ